MRSKLLEKLRCPACAGGLSLEDASIEDDDIVTGRLRCSSCDEVYPIEDSIPNLLPPDMR